MEKAATSIILEEQLSESFKKYHKQLIFFIMKKVGDKEFAEEIVQESFFKSVKSFSQIEDADKIKPWLYKITHNTMVDLLRRKSLEIKHLKASELNDEIFSNIGEDKELCSCMNKLFNELNDIQRRIIKMELDGETNSDISEQLKISKDYLKVIKHRANKKLYKLLEGHCGACAKSSCFDCECK